jgi:ketosteroid isomerase-like protein
MKYILLLIFLVVLEKTQAQYEKDSIAIVQLLKNDYATMGNYDIKTHVGYCTADYLLIENGEVWDLKKETEWYRTNAHRVLSRTDFFTIRTIKVHNNIAYAVYHLRSDFKENNTLKTKVWNESAIFRKEQGSWKIALIHSTPVPPANPSSSIDHFRFPNAYVQKINDADHSTYSTEPRPE